MKKIRMILDIAITIMFIILMIKEKYFGGHLNKAIVSATCEMVISIIEGNVDRYFDEEIGLNLFKF